VQSLNCVYGVSAMNDKKKPDIPCLLFLIISIIVVVLFLVLADKKLVDRSSFIVVGYILFFLHVVGLRIKRALFLRLWLFDYDSGSDTKRKIGFTINLLGVIAGVVLMCYGVYHFAFSGV